MLHLRRFSSSSTMLLAISHSAPFTLLFHMREPVYLYAARMTSIRGSVSWLQPAATSSSRGSDTVWSSLSRRGGPAWVRSRASSLRICRLWWSCLFSLGTSDSLRYCEIVRTTAVWMEVCDLPSSSSFLSRPLHPAEETGWKKIRMWASNWLAAEATNRLASVWSWRSGSMKSAKLGKGISVSERYNSQPLFLNFTRHLLIKLVFIINRTSGEMSWSEVSPDCTKKLRAFGCSSRLFKPWIQPILKQGSSQSPASCQRWRLKTRSRRELSCREYNITTVRPHQ